MAIKTIPNPIPDILTEFANNVLCRNESNQRKARKIFKEQIAVFLSEEDCNELWLDMQHYNMGEFTAEVFGGVINKLKAKYCKKETRME